MTFTNWVLSFFNRVQCDRCKRYVEGFLPGAGRCSAGVYVGWTEFMNFGEYIICDACMWKNDKFLAVYPQQRGAK